MDSHPVVGKLKCQPQPKSKLRRFHQQELVARVAWMEFIESMQQIGRSLGALGGSFSEASSSEGA